MNISAHNSRALVAATAVVCFLALGGATGAARADDQGAKTPEVTLYTPALAGDSFACNATNVSSKPLMVTFAILSAKGQPFSCASPNTCLRRVGSPPVTNPTPETQVLPGSEEEIFVVTPPGSLFDGYCAVSVAGTNKRDDVRAILEAQRTGTIQGTTIPTFVFRTAEGH